MEDGELERKELSGQAFKQVSKIAGTAHRNPRENRLPPTAVAASSQMRAASVALVRCSGNGSACNGDHIVQTPKLKRKSNP
jgi:hypothetical protein